MFLKHLFKVAKDHTLLFNLYATFRKGKSMQTNKEKSRAVVAEGWGEGHMGSENRSSQGDKNVLQLDSGDGCVTNILKTVNCTL